METSGTFDIVIQMPSSTESTAQAGTPAQPLQENEPVSQDPVRNSGDGGGKSSTVAAVAAGIALDAGKQVVSAAISNIGLATGNTYKQAQVEHAIAVGSKIVGVGVAIATQNYAAAIAMVVNETIQFATESWRMNKEREIADYQTAQYARKIGYTNARK
jgi:hypothetical protein